MKANMMAVQRCHIGMIKSQCRDLWQLTNGEPGFSRLNYRCQ